MSSVFTAARAGSVLSIPTVEGGLEGSRKYRLHNRAGLSRLALFGTLRESLRTNVHQNSGGAKEEADVVHHITDLKTTCQNKCVCTCSGPDQMAARPACSAHDDHTGAADECSLNAPTWAGPKGQSKEPKDMLAIRFLSGLNHPRSLSFPIYQMSYIECKGIFRFVNPRGFG